MNGNSGETDLGAIAHRAMLTRGLEPEFPTGAMQQLSGIPGPAREADPAIRDLRALLWCSIDNDSSRDLDQLTVAEPLPGGLTKILIAIADVDALVKTGSPLDRHAQANTTSVYTAAKIFPMLPERLSSDLTSLSEGQDRLVIVVEMAIAADGSVAESDIFRAVVLNRAKLAYRSVAAWLEGTAEALDRVLRIEGLADNLRLQDRIAQLMRSVRYLHGALELETIEPEAILSGGAVVDLRVDRKNRAKQLIEDFMIAANGVTASFLESRGWPVFRRIVRSPERWDRIRRVAEESGDRLPEAPDSKALAEFMTRRRLADPLRFPDLSLEIVKLLGAGEYAVQTAGTQAAGHFGLAVREYSHSTAPNRRFPDLITQRLLKSALAGGELPYSTADLTLLATLCTTREDAAKKVERQVRKSAAALYLSGRIGERFDAIVTGASEKGTWVRLLQPPAEGKLLDARPGISVGDRIRVRLTGLNVERGFIDFVRVEL